MSSAVRLHDQCIAIGQAAGAAAAVSLASEKPLRTIPFDRTLLTQVRTGLCTSLEGGMPMALWPFRDMAVEHPAFEAVNLLAVAGALPCKPDEVDFRPDEPATAAWRQAVVEATRKAKPTCDKVEPPRGEMPRGEFAARWWQAVRELPDAPYVRHSETDADGDGIKDADDALPLVAERR